MTQASASPASSDGSPRSIHPPGSTSTPKPRGLRAIFARDPNAIWMREMRQSARLARTPWILFSLVVSLALLLATIGGIAAANDVSTGELGGALFQVFFSLAYFVVILVGPAVAANSIASEREGRTWEAVLLTGMTPVEIARGKFLAGYTTVGLYIVALAPVGALPFLFGGVTAIEVIVAFAFLFLIAALAVALGLVVSSLMSSLRGAIVVTLMLAIAVGPVLFVLGGVTGSIAAHHIWSDVPEAFPVWLPLAYVRAPFGVEYLAILVALPALLVAVPAWFLYEATIANLTGDSDDRSTGLKRWFAVTAPVLALAMATPSLLASDDDGRTTWACLGMAAFAMHALLCAMLFASEPAGPSRRVTTRWQRANAGALRRFFGPGLANTSMLVVLVGALGTLGIALLDGAALEMLGSPGRARYLEEIAVFAAYVTAFGVFASGLVAWLRSRSQQPWIARIVAGGVLFLIAAAPWVAAAVVGALADSHPAEWLAVAAPSPFFAIAMVTALDRAHAEAPVLVSTGLTCAVLWGVTGLALLAATARKCAHIVSEHASAQLRADEALDREERERSAPGEPSEARPAELAIAQEP